MRLRIIEDLSYIPANAAAAALLLLSACATAGGAAQPQGDVASLRSELRSLQRENAELAKRVDSMATQVDILSARLTRAESSTPAERAASAAPPAAATTSATTPAAEPAPVVPANLKVVKLETPKGQPAPKGGKGKQEAPPVPTTMPIQEPTAAALAALAAGGKALASDAQADWERARALTGLTRARAMEQLADDHPTSTRAGEALVDAARARRSAGDPDGSCEDFARVVAEYTTSRAMPDGLEGLAACEQRRGRPGEASRLQARLTKDFPESPAGKRASEHAQPVQGAAP
jgi:TolA-binding protein